MAREGGEIPKHNSNEEKTQTAKPFKLSRRRLLQGVGVLAGAAILNRVSNAVKNSLEDHTGEISFPAKKASLDLQTNIGKEKYIYQDRLDLAEKEMSKNIASPEAKDRIKLYGQLISDVASEAGVPQDLFLGQIITESKVNPLAESGVGAKGLTQMMDAVAIKHSLHIAEYEGDYDSRFNPEEVLLPSAKELREYYDKFGDWSLAFEAWHMGTPQVYEAVRTYAHLEYGVELTDINVIPENESEEAYEKATLIATERMGFYRDFIKRHKISVPKLYENQTVMKTYDAPEFDRTWDYWARIVKSAEIIRSQNLIQVAQQQ